MKWTILAAGLAMFAGQANALSCMFGEGDVAFHQAAQNGEDFRAVIGSLSWDHPDDWFQMEFEGQEYDVAGNFRGEVLLPNGERLPIEEDVRVQTWCANGDCGYATVGEDMLTFLHNTPTGTVMHAYPCQSYPTGADDKTVNDVQQCIDGGPCSGHFDHEG